MRKRSGLLIVMFWFSTLQCAWRHGTSEAPNKVYSPKPFTLHIRVSPTTAAAGETLTLEYILTNTSDNSVDACLNDRGEYGIWAAGEPAPLHGHLGGGALDGPAANTIFTLPPHTSLVWRSEITMPDVRAGPAKLYGTFTSSCERWAGTVASQAVPIVIRLPGLLPGNH